MAKQLDNPTPGRTRRPRKLRKGELPFDEERHERDMSKKNKKQIEAIEADIARLMKGKKKK